MSGRGTPDGMGDRELRHRLVGLDEVDCVEHEAEALAEVGEADDDAGPRVGGEHEPHRVLARADAQRVDLDARHCRC